MNRHFNLKKPINMLPGLGGGSSRFIPPEDASKWVEEDLDKLYHRKNLCLKVLYNLPLPLEMNMYECLGSPTVVGKLVESVKIKNLFALDGIAPRVYDLVFLVDGGIKYATQVMDYVDGEMPESEEEAKEITDRIKEMVLDWKVKPNDVFYYNVKGNKLLDYQGFRENTLQEELINRIKQGLAFGGDTDIPYQSIEELGIKGRRDNLLRNKLIDFKGLPENFTVLDFGCNGGYFLRRAFDNGASYGVGVDIPRVARAAQELAIYLGYFNADFNSERPSGKFDVVFFLSMADHFPIEEIIPRVGKVMYFEGHAHGVYTPDYCMKLMKKYFSKVDLVGSVREPEQVERVIVRGEK